MEQLSSCYFCGAALDASLDEYPVVPKDLHPEPDEQGTVVLCQGCRRKLGTVVERVVSVAESSADGVPGNAVGGADSEGRVTDPSAGADDPADAGWQSGDALAADDTRRGASADDGAADATTGDSAGGSGRSDASATKNADSDEKTGVDGDDVSESGSGPADSSVGSGSNGSIGGGSDDESAGNADADDGPSLTALEYNKVMRLLQNREFPVDRAEFRAVATNAYEIGDAEFDAIVDAAVDRGLIAEQDGQFVDGN